MTTPATTTTTTLSDWATQQIKNLYLEADFTATVQSAFDPAVQTFVNGQKLTPDEFEQQTVGIKAASKSVEVNFGQVIEVPADDKNPELAGVVAGIYTITRATKFLVRAAPAQLQSTVVFQAKVETQGGSRRITFFVQTVQNQGIQVHLNLPQTGGAQPSS